MGWAIEHGRLHEASAAATAAYHYAAETRRWLDDDRAPRLAELKQAEELLAVVSTALALALEAAEEARRLDGERPCEDGHEGPVEYSHIEGTYCATCLVIIEEAA